jgi:hypothetical protein
MREQGQAQSLLYTGLASRFTVYRRTLAVALGDGLGLC